MIDYTWAVWFEALATSIAENDERYLAKHARAVDWGKEKDDVPLLAYGDENIDPMSFLYFLAQRNTINQFESIFRSVHKVFGIDWGFPESQPGVGPGLIIASECLHGEGAPHCQDTTPVFDMIARAETTRDRIGGFGRASAASEWLARHAAPIACRSV